MPELPEVETMVRGIREALEGRVLAEFALCPCACKPCLLEPGAAAINRRAVGRTFTRVWRRGKRAVLELDSGDRFVIEPRMTGLMLVADAPDTTHLRFVWKVRNEAGQPARERVWFWDRRGLGTVRLLSAQEFAAAVESRLGKDALDLTPEDWFALCAAARREIKPFLLDQRRVAGIGNLYASEILHLSRIHPAARANSLTLREVRRLAAAARDVLQLAIRYEGSTLGDGTYRNTLNQSGGYQNSHRVYDRAGETCPTCGRSQILRIVQAQRSTFYCPRCQPPQRQPPPGSSPKKTKSARRPRAER